MNPHTNRFEPLRPPSAEEQLATHIAQMHEYQRLLSKGYQGPSPVVQAALAREDGSPVPLTWSTYSVGEEVVVKNYRFRVKFISVTHNILELEPVGPVTP